MKKIVLSTLAALTIGTVSVSANQFYVNEEGQVFVNPGQGRTLLKSNDDSVSKTLSEADKKELKSDILAEVKKSTPLFSKSDKLKFSVLSYLGYTFNDRKDGETSIPGTDYKHDESNFEIRRAYFQVKAYLLDDPKSYYRVTLDMHQNDESDMVVRAKYAYLYLDNILPATGVELGLVHRPWHDYEEHNAWYYRNISKVLVEADNGAHLSNSADFGVNFKTKTKYFDSEVGVFNGEGYHDDFNDDEDSSASTGMSFEWRTTAHLLGVNGKDKQTEKTYFDVSFFGQYNQDHKDSASGVANEYDDLEFYGLHTVYNQPEFLLSAQYIYSDDTYEGSVPNKVSAQAGSGYSFNGEYRLGAEKEFRLLARYDKWTAEQYDSADEKDNETYIAGLAWEQNKNVQWVANITVTDNEDGNTRSKAEETENGNKYMLTAEIRF